MITLTISPVYGMPEIDAFSTAAPAVARPEAEGGGPFGRLVALYNDNVFLSNELASIKRQTASALARRASQGGTAFLDALISRLKERHSAALTMLRANRIAARAHLAGLEGPDASD